MTISELKEKGKPSLSTKLEIALFLGIAIGVILSYYVFSAKIDNWVILERMLYKGVKYEIVKIK